MRLIKVNEGLGINTLADRLLNGYYITPSPAYPKPDFSGMNEEQLKQAKIENRELLKKLDRQFDKDDRKNDKQLLQDVTSVIYYTLPGLGLEKSFLMAKKCVAAGSGNPMGYYKGILSYLEEHIAFLKMMDLA